MIWTKSDGLKLQIHELLKLLLENDNSLSSDFYEAAFPQFAEYLPEKMKDGETDHNRSLELAKSLIIDLISISVIQDPYNCKELIDKNEIFPKINQMLEGSKLQHMSLLKFYKCLVNSNYKPFITSMVKLNYADVIPKIWDKIVNKKGLVASVALELFTKIDKNGHFELAKYLCDKFENVKEYLQEAADKFKESQEEITKIEDNIMDGYEDSVDDQKANQAAYLNSLSFKDEEKQESYKKFDFLSQASNDQEEDDGLLIKPKVNGSASPVIQIDSNIFSGLNLKSPSSSKNGTKNILGNLFSHCIDEDYVHKPIEFEKVTIKPKESEETKQEEVAPNSDRQLAPAPPPASLSGMLLSKF